MDPALLKETVVLKLNGGLGTSMGLDQVGKPKNRSMDDQWMKLKVEIWKQLVFYLRKWINIYQNCMTLGSVCMWMCQHLHFSLLLMNGEAKSLLHVTDGNTFLDLIAKQAPWECGWLVAGSSQLAVSCGLG